MKRIKLTTDDKHFSWVIRDRDNWSCVRCGVRYDPPTNALQCSHFWGRGNKATRFDPKNADALCYGCHSLWESNKQGDYRDFKLKQLGEKEYQKLQFRAMSVCKESDAVAAFRVEFNKEIASVKRRFKV